MELKNIHMYFRRLSFSFLLVFFVSVTATVSYYRFMVNRDYLVGYEGLCDQMVHQCFVGCKDDLCADKFYYSKVIKHASDLYRECGENIVDCQGANVCLPGDYKCSITYCDSEIKDSTCSSISENINNNI